MKNFNLRNLSYKTFLFTLGLFWISIHFYFRLLIDRPTQLNLNDIQASTSFWIILFSYFIILHVLLIGVALKTVFFELKNNFVLEYLRRTINFLYWEPLLYIQTLISPHIPESANFFMFLESKMEHHRLNLTLNKSIIFSIHFAPQILVASIFSIEIIFYNNLRYFFPALFLLLLPISFSIFLSLYHYFADRHINEYNSSFEFINARDPICDSNGNPILNYDGTHAGYQTYEYKLLEHLIGVIDHRHAIETRIRFVRILKWVINIKILIAYYYPYSTLLTSSLYLLGGIYRLSYLLAKIFLMVTTLPI